MANVPLLNQSGCSPAKNSSSASAVTMDASSSQTSNRNSPESALEDGRNRRTHRWHWLTGRLCDRGQLRQKHPCANLPWRVLWHPARGWFGRGAHGCRICGLFGVDAHIATVKPCLSCLGTNQNLSGSGCCC